MHNAQCRVGEVHGRLDAIIFLFIMMRDLASSDDFNF